MRNVFYVRQLDILVIIFWFSFHAMSPGENNGNLSETKKKMFSLQHVSQPFLKMRKFLLDMRKDFLIMSNFYLVEILGEPNSLTIVISKKIPKMSNYVLILSISFLKMRIRNLQCNTTSNCNFLFFLALRQRNNFSHHPMQCVRAKKSQS